MKITTVKVSAGRTFNHPYEQYANFRSHAELEASLDAGEDPIAVTKTLQAQVEQLAEDHKQGLLKSVEELHNLGERQQEMIGLKRQLTGAQKRLEEIRREWPDIEQLKLSEKNIEQPAPPPFRASPSYVQSPPQEARELRQDEEEHSDDVQF